MSTLRPESLPPRLASRILLTDLMWNGTPCWRWIGQHRKQDGRPILNKRYVYGLTYEAMTGEPLPRGRGNATHHCCARLWCINPEHVKPMTQGQHLREHGLEGSRGQALKTHCPSGHPYDEKNTYRWRNERRCRECQRDKSLNYYHSNLEKCQTAARNYQRDKRRAQL